MQRKFFLRSLFSITASALAVPPLLAASSAPGAPFKEDAIVPPYLQSGDTVGITCPAGPVDAAKMQCCISTLEKWGLKVKLGNTVGRRWQRFGGTDDERLNDFQAMVNDREIKAIIFGKGGYGTLRIIDRIDWNSFMQSPKWLVGYSDLTVVHLHVQANLNTCTIHGDMSTGFSENPFTYSGLSLYTALFGNEPLSHTIKGFEMNRPGVANGRLAGGNLTLINACNGSPSDMNTDGKILFIEDVSEFKYNIDRMMMSLKRSGKLDNLAGLIVGGFTATRDADEETFDQKVEEIIWDKVKEYPYPVCFHFPAGHLSDNRALKLGATYSLNVSREQVVLSETNFVSRVRRPPAYNILVS